MRLTITPHYLILLILLHLEISGKSHVFAATSRPLRTLSQAAPTTKTIGQDADNLDIIFVLDGSGSLAPKNFEILKNWTSSMAKEFDVESGAVQIGVIQYSHWDSSEPDLNKQPYIKTEVALGQYSYHEQLSAAISDMEHQGYTTYTAHALNKTVLDFKASTRWESNATRKVLILVTDGRAIDAEDLPETAEYVRSLGITTYVVGVGEYLVSELRTIASGNLMSNERVYTVNDFKGLRKDMKSLKSDILKSVIKGPVVQNMDVIFALDGSRSIDPTNFEILKNWASRISREFDIESGTVQIGLIQYSEWDSNEPDLNKQTDIKTEVALGQCSSQQQLSTAIAGIRQQRRGTYTAHALNKTVLDFKASRRWESKSTRKVLILITDGSAIDASVLPETAEYVRSLGIITFAVGVGSYDIGELRTIASGDLTSDERVYTVDDFTRLSEGIKSIQSDILKSVVKDTTTRSQATTTTSLSLPTSSTVPTTKSAFNTVPETTAKFSYQSTFLPTAPATIVMTSASVNPTVTSTTDEEDFTEWSRWSSCSATCGNGEAMRYRVNLKIGKNQEQLKKCNDQKCNTGEDVYKNWLGWSGCSVTCGTGITTRVRFCRVRNCRDTETKPCTLPDCQPLDLDAKYGPWQKWSPCDATCGFAFSKRKRYCRIGGCEQTSSKTCRLSPCPTDYTEWQDWSECSVTCGSGTSIRKRFCTEGKCEEKQQTVCDMGKCGVSTPSPVASYTDQFRDLLRDFREILEDVQRTYYRWKIGANL